MCSLIEISQNRHHHHQNHHSGRLQLDLQQQQEQQQQQHQQHHHHQINNVSNNNANNVNFPITSCSTAAIIENRIKIKNNSIEEHTNNTSELVETLSSPSSSTGYQQNISETFYGKQAVIASLFTQTNNSAISISHNNNNNNNSNTFINNSANNNNTMVLQSFDNFAFSAANSSGTGGGIGLINNSDMIPPYAADYAPNPSNSYYTDVDGNFYSQGK